MTSEENKASTFRALHVPGAPLLMPNPWDIGSAKVLASLGFKALATTSSGHAATLGKLDGAIGRDESLTHAQSLVDAVDLPFNADLENGFADDSQGVFDTVDAAIRVGLAGCSIEDFSGDDDDPIYTKEVAVERISAAVDAAKRAPGLVLTARAENFIHDRPDLADTIERLQAFQEAGADVLYAPGISKLDDIRTLVREVDRPVNILARPGLPSVAELADAGVARISVGGSFNKAAFGALVAAARELLEQGTYGYLDLAGAGNNQMSVAFDLD
ncbi:2-methylisocitrate lyase-like PEP mutase family enzyme [Antricoccus suffuscus]|uniref:2-methylisocitrate lyase-like PEP mutase family enzyme n=1 Tax=Antricoccus suffuscus TaxID=1629062 RepID=A0A2T0ZW35_9ACTN|nr:isocitrate lyase/phosphoenolpyruvate mutase family protein [Antricoccus suffuscus]PRZ40562.1 2-methylisocitrate lyase-like PEP mutase family enzyme [Antricoccus suffuscus]